jgi:dethiobiotin synthetase
MRGLFVTGTGTGVGKTALAAALVAAMRAAGVPVRAHKPVLTGESGPGSGAAGDRPPGAGWPPDHELLGALAGMHPHEVAPLRYGPAVSPHLAAQLAGERIDPRSLCARARACAGGAGAVVVEGAGGLLVPLDGSFTMRELAAELGLPVLIAAAPSLGTINHTLLTLAAARSAALEPAAVVLTPWPAQPGTIERSNRETLERLGEVEVATLAHVATPEERELARAGEALPWRRWLSPARATASRVELLTATSA